MPSLSRITATFFVTLINRLGVRPPPPDGFELISTVQPVTIVDSDITLSAVTTTQLLDTPFTAGELAAPAINTVLADTGAQPVGNYFVLIIVNMDAAAGAGGQFRIQRRDAANAVSIWSQLAAVNQVGSPDYSLSIRAVLQLNERIRVITSAAFVGTVQASIFLQATT